MNKKYTLYQKKFEETLGALFQEGKGLLAIDESFPTIEKRFRAVRVASTEENRRAYRELLITNPGSGDYISGMILFDETIRQKTANGIPFPKALAHQGIVPGIKVDLGAVDLAGHPGELVTEGLDGLRQRLSEYKTAGAQFAKWRAVITIGENIPTIACLAANAHALARYAGLCQEAGLIPILESDVLRAGNHTIARCEEVTEQALRTLFSQLVQQDIILKYTILKTNMITAGEEGVKEASDEVAKATIRCLRATVPNDVAGVVFLSGGQDDQYATANLDAIQRIGKTFPWPITFSYSRALHNLPLRIWAGKEENVAAAQAALLHRERCNSFAARGQYTAAMEGTKQ